MNIRCARDRIVVRKILPLLSACGIALSLLLSALRAQERSPSIGKITYKPATALSGRTPQVLGPLVATRGKAVLLVLTEPGGAKISINGEPRGTSDTGGLFREEVPSNKEYKILVQAEKYLPSEDNVRIPSNQTRIVRINLTPTFGALRIYNVPQNAELSLDDRKIQYQLHEGKNEVTLAEIPVGAHQLKINHPDFVEWDKSVDVVPGFEAVVTPTMEPAARVTVSTLPAIEVLVDNVNQGITDADGKLSVRTPLQPGEHKMVLSKSGFVTASKPVNLARGDNLVSVPELEPTPSYIEFAEFFNDGMGLWEAPATWQWTKNLAAVTVQGAGLGLVKNRSYRDCDVTFNLKFTNNVGAAWVLRAKNTDNYYLFQLSVKERLLRTYVVEDGKTTAKEPSNILVDPAGNTSYQIRAEAQGDRIKHYIKNNTTGDEEMMGLLVDSRFRYGTVGLVASAAEQFLVEDFFVRPYPESPAR